MQNAWTSKKGADAIEFPVTAAFVAKMICCSVDNGMRDFPNVEFIEQWSCHRVKSLNRGKSQVFCCEDLLSFHVELRLCEKNKEGSYQDSIMDC